MDLINAVFPYPVLNPNTDDVSFNECSYTQDVRTSDDGRSFSLDFILNIDDPYIKNLIKNGDALYSMEVTCKGTYMLQRVADTDNHLHLDLEEGSVKGNVEISLTVTAVKTIENYCNPRAHEDYENQSFRIEPGEVIVFFATEILPTDIKYPQLGSAAAFIEVRPLADEKGFMIVDLDSPIIGINLPKEDYELYGNITDPKYQSIFHASLVQNALVYALVNFKSYKDKDLVWVKTLLYYFENIPEIKEMVKDITGVDEDGEEITISSNPILCQKLAQKILGMPNHKLLDSLKTIQDQEMHRNDTQEG